MHSLRLVLGWRSLTETEPAALPALETLCRALSLETHWDPSSGTLYIDSPLQGRTLGIITEPGDTLARQIAVHLRDRLNGAGASASLSKGAADRLGSDLTLAIRVTADGEPGVGIAHNWLHWAQHRRLAALMADEAATAAALPNRGVSASLSKNGAQAPTMLEVSITAGWRYADDDALPHTVASGLYTALARFWADTKQEKLLQRLPEYTPSPAPEPAPEPEPVVIPLSEPRPQPEAGLDPAPEPDVEPEPLAIDLAPPSPLGETPAPFRAYPEEVEVVTLGILTPEPADPEPVNPEPEPQFELEPEPELAALAAIPEPDSSDPIDDPEEEELPVPSPPEPTQARVLSTPPRRQHRFDPRRVPGNSQVHVFQRYRKADIIPAAPVSASPAVLEPEPKPEPSALEAFFEPPPPAEAPPPAEPAAPSPAAQARPAHPQPEPRISATKARVIQHGGTVIRLP